MSKIELLEECNKLGITKCNSKNKSQLIELINSKTSEKTPTTKMTETTATATATKLNGRGPYKYYLKEIINEAFAKKVYVRNQDRVYSYNYSNLNFYFHIIQIGPKK